MPAKDLQGETPKYPSKEQVDAWRDEWLCAYAVNETECEAEEFVARKAADWQREQDALICENQAREPECPERAQYCADAIRSGASHD